MALRLLARQRSQPHPHTGASSWPAAGNARRAPRARARQPSGRERHIARRVPSGWTRERAGIEADRGARPRRTRLVCPLRRRNGGEARTVRRRQHRPGSARCSNVLERARTCSRDSLATASRGTSMARREELPVGEAAVGLPVITEVGGVLLAVAVALALVELQYTMRGMPHSASQDIGTPPDARRCAVERALRDRTRMTLPMATGGRGAPPLVARDPVPTSKRPGQPHDAAAPEARADVRDFLAALRLLEQRLRQQAARRGPEPRVASPAELAVLRCLAAAPGPLSLAALAACVQRDASSVSVLVQRLRIRRLVQRKSDPQDSRRLRLSVTPAGRRVAQESPDGTGSALAHAVAAWPADRRRAALDLLTRITEVLATPGRTEPVPAPEAGMAK